MKKCTECQIEIEDRSQGRRRLTCSRKCRDARTTRINRERREPQFKDCRTCGETFEVSKSQRTYCSQKCHRVRQAELAKIRYAQQIAERPALVERDCSFCGKPVLIEASKPGYACHAECQDQRRKLRNRSKYLKRKEMKDSRLSTTFLDIGQRDKWTCYICEERVNKDTPRTSRMGGTLDHVVPVSRGGDDSYENLRLAHWICNVRKSDSLEFVNAESR